MYIALSGVSEPHHDVTIADGVHLVDIEELTFLVELSEEVAEHEHNILGLLTLNSVRQSGYSIGIFRKALDVREQ